VLVTLVVLFLVTPRTETYDFTQVEIGGLATSYQLVYECFLGIVGAATARRFWQAAQAAGRGVLRTSILILAVGAALGVVYGTYMTAILSVRLATRNEFPAGTLRAFAAASDLLQVASAIIVAGMLMPHAATAWRKCRRLADYHALYPLWRSLAADAPAIVLAPLPGKLKMLADLEMLMIRRVAEIRDGILLMHRRVGTPQLALARDMLGDLGLAGSKLDAAVEACAIDLGLRMPHRPAAPAGGSPVLPVPGGTDLAQETAWLRTIAVSRRSPQVRQVTSQLAASAALTRRTP
jgi:hypothetical protein